MTVVVDDGVRLWVARSGAGIPLVLCHGGPGMWDSLGPLAARVDDVASVYRWDQRGCGRSDPTGPYTIQRTVADLEVIRRAVAVERWAILGHSWGAVLALHYAAAHPGQTLGVLYLSGMGLLDSWDARNRAAAKQEAERRLSAADHKRLQELAALPDRTAAEEREYRLLSWSPDLRPGLQAEALLAEDLDAPWQVNLQANRALVADSRTSAATLRAALPLLDVTRSWSSTGLSTPDRWTRQPRSLSCCPAASCTCLIPGTRPGWRTRRAPGSSWGTGSLSYRSETDARPRLNWPPHDPPEHPIQWANDRRFGTRFGSEQRGNLRAGPCVWAAYSPAVPKDCFVCDKHASGDAFGLGVIYEDGTVFASHVGAGDGGGAYLGYVFAEVKRHVSGLGELTDVEARDLGSLVNDLAGALRVSEGAEHVYSYVAGDEVPHLHVHLVARYPGTPQEFWGARTPQWPGAPRGEVPEVRAITARLRDDVAARRAGRRGL